MIANDLHGCLTFLREAERLKSVLRSGHSSSGRAESTAEHSWRLCLMAMVFAKEWDGLDLGRMLQLCVLHDLGEALHGDVPAVSQTGQADKSAQERADLQTLMQSLPPAQSAHFMGLWEEYENALSPEARIVKGLDKLETILQHNQGVNPPDFDYGFNLDYGQKHMAAHPLLGQIRALLDAQTRQRQTDASSAAAQALSTQDASSAPA
ncbi:MAG: HD domain-containing protein [Rhodoferax sp.]|nr:HD domain-containing protein [Rhodoferax sp.]